jgi:hypothetical protein
MAFFAVLAGLRAFDTLLDAWVEDRPAFLADWFVRGAESLLDSVGVREEGMVGAGM